MDTLVRGRVERYSRWLPIQSNPHSFQLGLQQPPLLRLLRRIQNHANHITRLRGRNDLPSSPLTLRSSLNNTRQIENLDLSPTILEHARNRRQSGERVRRDNRLRLGDFGEESGLSDRGEADERDAGVAALRDVEAGAGGCACAWSRFEELGA